MRRTLMIATATALLALTSTASARDTRVEQSLQELVSSQAAKDAGIDGSVRFYLAGQPVSVQQRLGEDAVAAIEGFVSGFVLSCGGHE